MIDPPAKAPTVPPVEIAPVEITLVEVVEDDAALATLLQVLSPDERGRAEKWRVPADRARFIVGRAALRHLLGSRLGVAPSAMQLRIAAGGKPVLASRDCGFNLSHSGRLVAIAIAASPVGIDIEASEPAPPSLDASAFLTPEETAALAAAPDPKTMVLQLWTMKEAVAKAVGAGLALPFTAFALPAPSRSLRPVRALVADRRLADLHVAAIPSGPGYAAAVAVQGESRPIDIRHLPAPELALRLTTLVRPETARSGGSG